MTHEQAALRTSLRHGLVESARRNVDAGNEGISLFEIARVYLPAEPLPDEQLHLAGITNGGFPRARRAAGTFLPGLPLQPRLTRPEAPHLPPGKTAPSGRGHQGGGLHPAAVPGGRGYF